MLLPALSASHATSVLLPTLSAVRASALGSVPGATHASALGSVPGATHAAALDCVLVTSLLHFIIYREIIFLLIEDI